MRHVREGAGLREQDLRDVTRMRTEKFAFAAHVLHIIGFLQCGGFLLDPRRHLLSLNPIATDFLGNGLVLRGNCLVAMDRESDARLQSSIELALNLTESASVPATWLEVHRAASVPILIRILRLEESAGPALNGASLLLVAFDPEIRPAPPADLLTRMFALTRAEADVAIGLAYGRRVAEIAADRGVKIETVRTQSKTVFAKTRTRGQAELTALLTRLAFLVPHREAGVGQANALRDLPIFRSAN
jgi:DNA-binding CsgD family transcriptional regulator